VAGVRRCNMRKPCGRVVWRPRPRLVRVLDVRHPLAPRRVPNPRAAHHFPSGALNSVSAFLGTLISSKSRVYSLKDRDQVGQSASRSVGFSKWTVLIGRTGFDTIPSIPDPTLSLTACTFQACQLGSLGWFQGQTRTRTQVRRLAVEVETGVQRPPPVIDDAHVLHYARPRAGPPRARLPFPPQRSPASRHVTAVCSRP